MTLFPYSLIPVLRLFGWRGRVNYRDYLHSAAWAKKRSRVHMRSGYRCEWCGGRGRLQVHHLTYERLGHERLSDLVDLCPRCHRGAHNR